MTEYLQKTWVLTGPQTLTIPIPPGVWAVDRVRLGAASGWTGAQSAVITRRHDMSYLLDETLETLSLSGTKHAWVPLVDADWLYSPALIGQPKGAGDSLEIAVTCGAADAYVVEAILFRSGTHQSRDMARVEGP